MQYILQLTVLGTEHHIFRVISVDGLADAEHVTSLCNLAFGYENEPKRCFAFSGDNEALAERLCLSCPKDDGSYGPQEERFSHWWTQAVTTRDFSCHYFSEQECIVPFDEIIAEGLSPSMRARLKSMSEGEPCFPEDYPRFLYSVGNLVHLVEVKACAEKLMCFLPATLAGEGLIGDGALEAQVLDDYLDTIEAQDIDESEYSVNLRDCTHRMRALGAIRGDKSAHEALVQAGASALKWQFK